MNVLQWRISENRLLFLVSSSLLETVVGVNSVLGDTLLDLGCRRGVVGKLGAG